jgi:hypothetical protein
MSNKILGFTTTKKLQNPITTALVAWAIGIISTWYRGDWGYGSWY